ncbi:MAG: energy transducer TonB [Chitinophagaceae bacterium]|jgi:protein TonB|nr:energy transducer TonB [Chitinophagaceae bacterium]
MDAQKILTADLDDLVFEGRNKSYGAYDLRKRYGKHITMALLISIGIYTVAFVAPYLFNLLKPEPVVEPRKEIKYTELSEPPPIDKNTPPPPPPDLPPPPPKTIKFTPPVIKPDEEVKEEDIPPPVEELQQAEIATVTEVDPNATYDFSANQETQVVEEKKPEIFMYVEQMPEFPGGQTELIKYLQKNLRYPAAARENGIEGKVVLQFVVDESGKISDLQVVRDIGGGCAEEATRVVKNMPPWKPGKQNGNAVKVYFKLPVTFKLGTE